MAFNPNKYDPQAESSKGHEQGGVLVIATTTKKDGDKTVESSLDGSLQYPKKGKFIPGGDARLKGRLIRAAITGTKVVHVRDGKSGSPESALAVAKRHGWDEAIKAAVARHEDAEARKAERAADAEEARKVAAAEKAAAKKAEKAAAAA